MSEDGEVEGACERSRKAMGTAIPTLPPTERSSARNTRRAVGARQCERQECMAGEIGEASVSGHVHEIDDKRSTMFATYFHVT